VEVFTLERQARTDKFAEEVAHRFAGYTVCDQDYEKIGNVDDLFLDQSDHPEYIGVKMGFLGTRTTLIPVQMARVNEALGAGKQGDDPGHHPALTRARQGSTPCMRRALGVLAKAGV
jgi:PRC-barrel domain